MISVENYYNSLSKEQQTAVQATIDAAEERGLDITIIDAVDIWDCMPSSLRGPKP